MPYLYAGQYGPEPLFSYGTARILANTGVSVLVSGTSTPAVLYTDRSKSTTVSNVVSTDDHGNLLFFADPGRYDIVVGSTTLSVFVPLDPEEISGWASVVSQPEPPVSPEVDQLWIDTDAVPTGEGYIPSIEKAVPNGIATLGADGKLLPAQSGTTVVSVRTFGAVGDGVVDDTDAIEAAIAAVAAISGGGVVVFPAGTYRITNTLVIDSSGVRLVGMGSGSILTGVALVYDGVAGATTAMVKCNATRHGFQMEGFRFDANNLAGICVWIDVGTGQATHHPRLARLHFANYTSRGLVLGKNDLTTVHAGQLRNVVLDDLGWQGGTVGAIGLLANAQNMENCVLVAPYFDPTEGKEHAQHIYLYSGGMIATGLLTTRSTGYAVISRGQFDVLGWRAEEALLLKLDAVNLGNAVFLGGITQRSGLAVAGDASILLNHITSPVVLNGVSLYGSVKIGPTDAKLVSATGVAFPGGGAFILDATSAVHGVIHDGTIGSFRVRGTDPIISSEGLGGATGFLIRENVTNKWQLYKSAVADPALYLRDMANARMHATFTPGATAALAISRFSSLLFTGSSTTAARPSASTAGQGAQWYDTDLGKPIWSSGTVWKDAAGNTV